MWEMEAAAKAATSDGMSEEVFDNSDGIENSAIPIVILKEKSSCPTYSSNDQKVPSFHNFNNESLHRKRAKYVEDQERLHADKLNSHDKEAGTSRGKQDLCSTAESSASKGQSSSRMSYSVPQSCSSSDGKPSQEYESCDPKQSSWQEKIDLEKTSSKNGK